MLLLRARGSLLGWRLLLRLLCCCLLRRLYELLVLLLLFRLLARAGGAGGRRGRAMPASLSAPPPGALSSNEQQFEWFGELPLLGVSIGSTVVALAVSLYTVGGHVVHWTLPEHQRYVCRILLLVPVYASLSLGALVRPQLAPALGTLRDCYEALAIYTFLQLLMVYLGGDRAVGEWLELRGHMRHAEPLRLLCPQLKPNVQLGHAFLLWVRRGVLQFVFVKPLMALVALGAAWAGRYHEGSPSPRDAYAWTALVNNVSVSLALYCLVMFYLACESILEPFEPLAKFLVVKSVVFFSYWQYCTLVVLALLGVLPGGQAQASRLQSALVCAEMAVAALAHAWAFPWSDYVEDPRKGLGASSSKMARVLASHSLAQRRFESFQEEQEEQEDAENADLLPKLVKIMDGRDVLREGKSAFLSKQARPANELDEKGEGEVSASASASAGAPAAAAKSGHASEPR